MKMFKKFHILWFKIIRKLANVLRINVACQLLPYLAQFLDSFKKNKFSVSLFMKVEIHCKFFQQESGGKNLFLRLALRYQQ
jgi:hypothetical protein